MLFHAKSPPLYQILRADYGYRLTVTTSNPERGEECWRALLEEEGVTLGAMPNNGTHASDQANSFFQCNTQRCAFCREWRGISKDAGQPSRFTRVADENRGYVENALAISPLFFRNLLAIIVGNGRLKCQGEVHGPVLPRVDREPGGRGQDH